MAVRVPTNTVTIMYFSWFVSKYTYSPACSQINMCTYSLKKCVSFLPWSNINTSYLSKPFLFLLLIRKSSKKVFCPKIEIVIKSYDFIWLFSLWLLNHMLSQYMSHIAIWLGTKDTASGLIIRGEMVQVASEKNYNAT